MVWFHNLIQLGFIDILPETEVWSLCFEDTFDIKLSRLYRYSLQHANYNTEIHDLLLSQTFVALLQWIWLEINYLEYIFENLHEFFEDKVLMRLFIYFWVHQRVNEAVF